MSTFEFYSVGRIIFGRGQFARIGQLAAQLGRRALVVTNVGRSGVAVMQRLVELLARRVGHSVLHQQGEPKVEDVDAGVAQARQDGCDLVIGLGGESAIDAAKAVAGLLTNGGSAIDYMEVIGSGGQIARPACPWVAVPTTAGTGAEVTRNAVIGCPEKRFKASIRSEHLLPRLALVDAELGVDVRPEVTARSGMDALCQLIEAYTSVGASPLTDALAIEGLAMAGGLLLKAYRDGHDLDAREDMAMAATLSGIALTNAGLGAVHGLAAPLGASFGAPHGAICAALLPHVMRANVEALRALSGDHPALKRYACVGRTLSGSERVPDASAIDDGLQFVGQLVRDLAIDSLRKYGIAPGDVKEVVALAAKSSSMRYNPVPFSSRTLEAVLEAAL